MRILISRKMPRQKISFQKRKEPFLQKSPQSTFQSRRRVVTTNHNDCPPETPQHPDPGDTDGSLQDISSDLLPARVCRPTLTLPSFVDEHYIAETTRFTPRDLRLIHEQRDLIRKITGYPWPDDKPAPDDIPRILLDAIRYPAFVIAFKPRFFPSENRSERSFLRRHGHMYHNHPLPKKHRTAIELNLNALEHGIDPNLVRDDLFWLAARAAWETSCNRVDLDLLILIDRGGIWAEIGTYLYEVIEPFIGPSKLTIGHIFTKEIIPAACARQKDARGETPDVSPEENAMIAVDQLPMTTLVSASDESAPAGSEPVDFAGVIAAWRRRSEEMRELSIRSVETGPDANIVTHLRSTLKALEDLKDAAERLTPKSVSCAALVAELQQMIDEVEAAFNQIIGPSPEAIKIRSDLTLVGAETDPDHFAAAETARNEAQTQRSRAADIALEIEELDGSGLPMRARLAKSGLLIDEQEEHLRSAMSMIGVSVQALVEGSVAPPADRAIEIIPQPAGPSLAIPASPPAPELPPPARLPETAAAKTYAPPATHIPDTTSTFPEDANLDHETVLDTKAVLDHDDLFDPDYRPDQDLPLVDPPQHLPAEPEPEPPLGHEVLRCLDRLFVLAEFGLAYHLAVVAGRLILEFDTCYDPAEFRLAAAAGRSLNLDAFELQSLQDARSEALGVAQKLEDKDDDRSLARRILLVAGSLPAALLRSDDSSALSLLKQIGDRGPLCHYHPLFQVLEDNRKRGYLLTAANLAAAAALSHEATFIAEAVAEIRATIEQFRSARIQFQPGERLNAALNASNGILGELARDIEHNPRQAVDKVAERQAIVNLLTEIAHKPGDKPEDGPARHRIINALSRIGQQCADLHESLEQMQVIRRAASRHETLQRLRSETLSAIDHILNETETPSGNHLVDAANAHARRILENLQSICRGRAAERNQAPLAVALHSPLLWLPGLTWTGGWTPSPYEDAQILNAILAAHTPLLGDDRTESWNQAFQARKLECAFVPAKMLLAVAGSNGVDSAEISARQDELAADVEARRENVQARIEKTGRQIDRMRRMAVGTLDQAARLTEALAAINVDALPAMLDDTFLPESVSGDRIVDFNIAQAKLDEIEREVTRQFEKEGTRLSERIDKVCGKRSLDQATRQQLVNLLDRSEFTTLSDWLNILDKGEGRKPRLPTGTLNTRLVFFQKVLHDLTENNQNFDILTAKRHLESGSDYRLIDYGRPDQDRRDDSAEALTSYVALKRTTKAISANSAVSSSFPAQVAGVISNLFYDVTDLKEDSLLTARRQSRFVFDAKIALPHAESTSLVLPEFGSATNSAWRICIVSSASSNNEFIQLANDVGARGVLILVTGVLLEDRRTQIRTDLIRKKRSALIVDETMLAVALSDPDDRRQALVEMAQGYSYANPYKDHARAAVPPEMFKGRTDERNAIIDQTGSYVVFGGRRLGKTALLRHIVAEQPPHAKYTYVDLYEIQHAADAFDRTSEKIGNEIFKASVRGSAEFAAAITTWLNGDERRRLLLLIDEADKFVRSEAETGFRCIEPMLKLMADTKNRFKFVLAGLHNVSRIVRAENSPLVQISNNPLRIGPLVERDVDDAEFLVRGPFAAMGYEFDSREDVWRILSFTNYYPVLIQLFCQELLGLIHEEVLQTGKPAETISTKLVDKTLTSSKVKKNLFDSFEKTINVEARYELITYLLANREMLERESGLAAEGMTPGEVAEQAMAYWPAAFPKGSDPNELEYLLDELDGFGIARRTASGQFALRSRSLLELMATSESDLRSKLGSFRDKAPPLKPFDPQNARRKLSLKTQPQSADAYSPLTDGQEAMLLSGELNVGVVFGPPIAGIAQVEPALRASKRALDKMTGVQAREIETRVVATKRDLFDAIKQIGRGSRQHVLVVNANSPWRPDWVLEAERIEKVRKHNIRLVFIGSREHAEIWSADPTVRRRTLPQIRLVKLRPWAPSFLGSSIDALQLKHDLVERILKATGGWNDIVSPLMEKIGDKPDYEIAATLIGEAAEKALALPGITTSLGIPDELLAFFRELAIYAKVSPLTTADFQDICTWDGRTIDPKTIGAYGDLMGLLSFPPDEGPEHQHNNVDVNPLALAALTEGS